MGMTITLPEELADKVRQEASKRGQDAEKYAISALQKALNKPTLDEILAPVREQFVASGMTEEELTALVKEERGAMWQEKQGEHK